MNRTIDPGNEIRANRRTYIYTSKPTYTRSTNRTIAFFDGTPRVVTQGSRPGDDYYSEESIKKRDSGLKESVVDPISMLTERIAGPSKLVKYSVKAIYAAIKALVKRESSQNKALKQMQKEHDDKYRDPSFRSHEQSGIDRFESRERMEKITGEHTKIA